MAQSVGFPARQGLSSREYAHALTQLAAWARQMGFVEFAACVRQADRALPRPQAFAENIDKEEIKPCSDS